MNIILYLLANILLIGTFLLQCIGAKYLLKESYKNFWKEFLPTLLLTLLIIIGFVGIIFYMNFSLIGTITLF